MIVTRTQNQTPFKGILLERTLHKVGSMYAMAGEPENERFGTPLAICGCEYTDEPLTAAPCKMPAVGEVGYDIYVFKLKIVEMKLP